MKEQAQFISLDEIVKTLFIDEGKSSEHEYLRYFNMGLRGLKELTFDVIRQVKTAVLTLDSKNTVRLPSDYVSYINIAAAGANGEMQYLGRKNRLPLIEGVSGSAGSESTDPPVFTDNTPGDGLWGRYGYGGGGNANGYYRENHDARTIEFGDVTGTIVLEYISDGSTGLTGEQIKVHAFAEEALRAFIYWKSIQRKRAINRGEKTMAQQEYYNQKRLAVARMKSFNKAEALQTSRKAFKQSPKL